MSSLIYNEFSSKTDLQTNHSVFCPKITSYIQLYAVDSLHNSLWFAMQQLRFVKKYMDICNDLSKYSICGQLVITQINIV